MALGGLGVSNEAHPPPVKRLFVVSAAVLSHSVGLMTQWNTARGNTALRHGPLSSAVLLSPASILSLSFLSLAPILSSIPGQQIPITRTV